MVFATATQSLIPSPIPWPRVLRRLVGWERGFEFRLGHGCPSLVSVVCCQVEISAMG